MKRSRFQVIKKRPREERTSPEGYVFDSVGEMKRWADLCELQRRGEIRSLTRQLVFPLHMKDDIKTAVRGQSGRQLRYTVDFQYEERDIDAHGLSGTWVTIYEDYKGVDDPTSKLRRSFVEAMIGQKIRITGPAAKKLKKVAK